MKNQLNYKTTSFDAPYLINEYPEKWQSTLEGSRSGTGICAAWLSHQSIGLTRNGYGRILDKGIMAKNYLNEKLLKLESCTVVSSGDTNIVCFIINKESIKLSELNSINKKLIEELHSQSGFSVSKTYLDLGNYKKLIEPVKKKLNLKQDTDSLLTIRCVLMNPFVISKTSNIVIIDEFIEMLKVLSRKLLD